jgi:hypothetical protein
VPIVLVGSQRSSDRPSSDAALNLIHSVRSAAYGDVAEVQICMFGPTSDRYGLLHRGTRCRKMHSSYRSTFRTVGDIPLATVSRDSFTYLTGDYRTALHTVEIAYDIHGLPHILGRGTMFHRYLPQCIARPDNNVFGSTDTTSPRKTENGEHEKYAQDGPDKQQSSSCFFLQMTHPTHMFAFIIALLSEYDKSLTEHIFVLLVLSLRLCMEAKKKTSRNERSFLTIPLFHHMEHIFEDGLERTQHQGDTTHNHVTEGYPEGHHHDPTTEDSTSSGDSFLLFAGEEEVNQNA